MSSRREGSSVTGTSRKWEARESLKDIKDGDIVEVVYGVTAGKLRTVKGACKIRRGGRGEIQDLIVNFWPIGLETIRKIDVSSVDN